ncbi:MAG: glutamate racemase [Pontixanthobacter sp.]
MTPPSPIYEPHSGPILIFDSGVGGLTVLAELRAAMPDASVIYAADQAGLPYGDKSEAEIAARVAGLLGRMSERYRPRLICIACNTASTIALGMVRDVLEIPIVGTVPAIKPAAAVTRTGTIGLLGTQATIRQHYVDQLHRQFAAETRLVRQAAPDLVALAEAKLRGRPVDHAIIARCVADLRSKDGGAAIDAVVLACTHFPLLRDELQEAFGPDVVLIDGAAGIARRIAAVCGQDIARDPAPSFAVTTGDLAAFQTLSALLAAFDIARIERF